MQEVQVQRPTPSLKDPRKLSLKRLKTSALKAGNCNARSPFLHLQMSLVFSGPHTLHVNLDKTLLVESGHATADFIWQKPSTWNQFPVPSLTALLKTNSLTGSFIECCAHRHISHCHPRTQGISEAKINIASFLWLAARELFRRLFGGLLFPSYLPSPLISDTTLRTLRWVTVKVNIRDAALRKFHPIQVEKHGPHCSHAIPFGGSAGANDVMKWRLQRTLQMGGASKNGFYVVFRRAIYVFPPYELDHPPDLEKWTTLSLSPFPHIFQPLPFWV